MSDCQNALRISQLDAAELDTQLFAILQNQFRNIFQYFKANWLVRYDPEFNAALKFVLWKYTINASGQTIGQRLLDLKYRDVAIGTSDAALTEWMTKKQKLLYLLLLVVGPWLSQRAETFRNMTQTVKYSSQMLSQHSMDVESFSCSLLDNPAYALLSLKINLTKFWTVVRSLEIVWDITSLLNFLVFLVKGKYQFVIERVLGIRSVFPRPQGIRQVGFEYMDRELLWHGFAEFLFFTLPLVNVRRIKNFMKRNLLPKTFADRAVERVPADLKECVVCGEWPYNPREIGCKHVFCFYCIKANYQADPGFCCPACGKSVMENIKPLRIRVEDKLPVIHSSEMG